MDVKLLMQTEVGEVYEPFHEGRGSSSTMPQKRNPISCLYIHATAALVRQNAAALLEAAVADHERSTGPWEIEWIALPEIFLLSSGALRAEPRPGRRLAGGRRADAQESRPHQRQDRVGSRDDGARPASRPPARPRSRLRHLPRIGDRRASRWSICWRKDAEISRHVTRAELEKMCDPANYLGLGRRDGRSGAGAREGAVESRLRFFIATAAAGSARCRGRSGAGRFR